MYEKLHKQYQYYKYINQIKYILLVNKNYLKKIIKLIIKNLFQLFLSKENKNQWVKKSSL